MEKDTSCNDATSQPIMTVAETLQSVQSASADTSIILDLDETLFLRNSTQEYLNSIYPRPLGAAMLVVLKALKPWRLLPGQFRDEAVSRDWLLVVTATLLFPWTLLLWQWRAKKLAQAYCNWQLVQAVEANPQAQVVIATLGFDWIVQPLIQHLPLVLRPEGGARVVSCRFWQGMRDRVRGKYAMVTEALGEAAVSRAVAVTDATVDNVLLAAVAVPCLLKWPEAKFVPAMRNVYVPLFYSERVKNPNTSHVFRRVLLGHWAFLVISLSWISPHPVVNAVGLLLLTFSYWCVYEIGYQENDLIGEQYETKPMLSENYAHYKSWLNLARTPAPWYAAIGLSLPGILLLAISQQRVPIMSIWGNWAQLWPVFLADVWIWLAFLIAVRLTFWVYNQLTEDARIWVYPILQIQKLFGFTLLASTSMVGSLFLLALVVARWMHYSIYRCGGNRWRFPLNLSCLVLFVMMLCAIAVGSADPLSLLTWQSVIAIAYCCIRSFKGWLKIYPHFGLLAKKNTIMSDRSKIAVLLPDENGQVGKWASTSSVNQSP